VLTNENQWEQSAAILIKKAVFDATLEVPWEFVRTCERRYTSALCSFNLL